MTGSEVYSGAGFYVGEATRGSSGCQGDETAADTPTHYWTARANWSKVQDDLPTRKVDSDEYIAKAWFVWRGDWMDRTNHHRLWMHQPWSVDPKEEVRCGTLATEMKEVTNQR